MTRKRKPAPPSTPYRAYLRGRLRAAGLLDDAEAELYKSLELPTSLLIGFVLGALAAEGAALLGELQVEAEVAARLAAEIPRQGPAERPGALPLGPMLALRAAELQSEVERSTHHHG